MFFQPVNPDFNFSIDIVLHFTTVYTVLKGIERPLHSLSLNICRFELAWCENSLVVV